MNLQAIDAASAQAGLFRFLLGKRPIMSAGLDRVEPGKRRFGEAIRKRNFSEQERQVRGKARHSKKAPTLNGDNTPR